MPPIVAFMLFVVLVAVLLRIERRRNPTASRALWLPTFWLLICGSRPVANWFGPGLTWETSVTVETGNPIDRSILIGLILLAFMVISSRKLDWSRVRKDNACLFVVYILIGFSIFWADFQYVSLKRWVRASGVIVMAILILSEREPRQALESVLRRNAYILIPFSFLLIMYFPHFGVQYHRLTGQKMWVGVSTQKNGLGEICALSAFFLIWAALRKWRTGEFFKNKSQSFADVFVISLAIYMLRGPGGSYSATSIAVLIIGTVFLMVLNRRENLTRRIAAHLGLLIFTTGIICFLVIDTFLPMVSSLLGRDATLTGRVYFWNQILDVAFRNQLFGVGFGSFWGLGDDLFTLGSAHNGYVGVFLDLGIYGLALLLALLLSFCRKVNREINNAFDWGVSGACFLVMVVLYNITESAFFQTSYIWTIFVFMMVIFSAPLMHNNGV